MPDLLTSAGKPVPLGHELGRGGEGSVFEVVSDAGLVAKIYHQTLAPTKAEKIRVMVKLRTDRLASLTAWPVDLLLKRSGEPAGLLMPKVTGRKDIHRLYSPKSRSIEFTSADWRFLIAAAANTARAFAVVHESGCVIGDVNHGGVMVSQDATVRLIDCDSFQVIYGGRRFLCEVGIEDFTPPELQGRPFAGVIRTPNHDNFGLAVLIFRLLFMGRHPFAGRFLGRGEMPLTQAIAECRFAYGSQQAAIQMERPPGAPPLGIVGNVIGSFFEQSFAREMTAGGRPTARQWAEGLDGLRSQLSQCRVNGSHWYLRALPTCPWCAMEAATGASLFPVLVPQFATGQAFNIDALWRQVLAVQHPGPAPALATRVATSSADARRIGRVKRNRAIAGPAGAIAAILFGLLVLPFTAYWWVFVAAGVAGFYAGRAFFQEPKTDIANLGAICTQAYTRRSTAIAAWEERAGARGFNDKRAELDRLKRAWDEIPALRTRKLQELQSNQRRLQLERFLDRFEIEKASITGIGAGRKQILESYGVETAADVTPSKVSSIPGFGRVLTSNLFSWRQSVEARFFFDPARAIDPKDVANVEREVLSERQRLETALRTAAEQLKQIRAQIMTAREQLRPQVEAANVAWEQAKVDVEASRG